MRLLATTSAIPDLDRSAERRQQGSPRSARLMGLAIASLVPAAFWSGLIEAVTLWLGTPLTFQTIALTFLAIAVFLAVVCAPIFLRDPA